VLELSVVYFIFLVSSCSVLDQLFSSTIKPLVEYAAVAGEGCLAQYRPHSQLLLRVLLLLLQARFCSVE
jgi:hypothetical protein